MTEQDARTALRRLAADVRKHYGERLRGVYLVDAKDLYDDEDAADLETVIVLADGEWRSMDERMALVDMTYDILLDTELYIRALPVSLSDWMDPAAARRPQLDTGPQRKGRADHGGGVNVFWAKAVAASQAARLLYEHGYPDGAANRAYYAMFHAARVALASLDSAGRIEAPSNNDQALLEAFRAGTRC